MLLPNLSHFENSSLTDTQFEIELIRNLIDISRLPLGLYSAITNLICIVVIAQPELKGVTFQYMLASSISDFILALIFLTSLVSKCERFCSISRTFGAQFFDLYIYYYGTNIFELFSNLVDIALAVDRLFLITGNKNFRKINPIFIQIGMFIFSALFNISFVLTYKISPSEKVITHSNNHTEKLIVYDSRHLSSFGMSKFAIGLTTAQSIFRGIVLVLILSIINLTMCIKYGQHMQKKKTMVMTNQSDKGPTLSLVDQTSVKNATAATNPNQNKQIKIREPYDRNLSKMIICMCLIYIMGNLPLSFLITYMIVDPSSLFTYIMALIATDLDILSHSSYIFVYYRFNTLFKKEFRALFGRLNRYVCFWRAKR